MDKNTYTVKLITDAIICLKIALDQLPTEEIPLDEMEWRKAAEPLDRENLIEVLCTMRRHNADLVKTLEDAGLKAPRHYP